MSTGWVYLRRRVRRKREREREREGERGGSGKKRYLGREEIGELPESDS